MPLQGPFAVIADQPARDVVDALRAAGAYPIIEARWADAVAVLRARSPQPSSEGAYTSCPCARSRVATGFQIQPP